MRADGGRRVCASAHGLVLRREEVAVEGSVEVAGGHLRADAVSSDPQARFECARAWLITCRGHMARSERVSAKRSVRAHRKVAQPQQHARLVADLPLRARDGQAGGLRGVAAGADDAAGVCARARR